jgi:hypothetical protein
MVVRQFNWNPYSLFPISIGLFLMWGVFAASTKRAELNRRRRASLAMS